MIRNVKLGIFVKYNEFFWGFQTFSLLYSRCSQESLLTGCLQMAVGGWVGETFPLTYLYCSFFFLGYGAHYGDGYKREYDKDFRFVCIRKMQFMVFKKKCYLLQWEYIPFSFIQKAHSWSGRHCLMKLLQGCSVFHSHLLASQSFLSRGRKDL